MRYLPPTTYRLVLPTGLATHMNECGRSKVKQLLRSSMLARLLVPFRAAPVRPVWPDEVSSQRSHHTSDHQPGAGRMRQGIYSHLVTQYESFDDCGLQQLPRFDPFPISRDACDGLRSGPWQMRLPQKICSGGISHTRQRPPSSSFQDFFVADYLYCPLIFPFFFSVAKWRVIYCSRSCFPVAVSLQPDISRSPPSSLDTNAPART